MHDRPRQDPTDDGAHQNGQMPRDAIPPHADGAGMIFGGPVAAWLRQRGGYALRGFRQPDYRRYWCMLLADTFGIWMRNTATVWLVYALSGNDERMLGWYAAAAAFTPMFLLPFTGAVADRFNRRAVMACVQAAQGLLAVLVAVLVFREAMGAWHLVAYAAVTGGITAFRQPVNQSILVNVVAPKDIANAVALNHVQVNLTRISAPVLAGLLIAHVGAFWPFVVQAIASVVSLALLARMRYSGKAPRPNVHVLKALAGGIRYLRTRSDLVMIIALVLLSAVFGQISTTMLPALAKQGLGGDATAYGTLISFFALGALVGAVTLATRRGRPLSLLRASVPLTGWAILQMAIGLTDSFAVVLALMACLGACFTGARAMLFAGIHSETPDHVRGRISSFYTLSIMAGAGAGGWVAGQLAERIGVQIVFQAFGLALLLLVPFVLLAARRFGATRPAALQTETIRS